MSRLIRIAWTLVLAMMLAAAAWSISGQLIRWGMTPWLAWGLSLMFDLAGLICAEYARRAVERNTPAGLPRIAILGFVSVSAVLNFAHGKDVGGLPAAYGLASISLAVELLFELHRRDVRDEQRAQRGLVAERMPHIPLLGWLMYPGRAWSTLRGAVGARLDQLDPVQTRTRTPRPDTADTADRSPATVRSGVRAAADTFPGASPEELAGHLTGLGIPTTPDTVRAVLHADTDTRPDTTDTTSDGTVRPIRTGRPRPADTTADTIADTIRTALASGVTDTSAVLSAVRSVHGQRVSADTVARTRRRIERTA